MLSTMVIESAMNGKVTGDIYFACRLLCDYADGMAAIVDGRPCFMADGEDWTPCRIADLCILGEVTLAESQRLAEAMTNDLAGMCYDSEYRNSHESTRGC